VICDNQLNLNKMDQFNEITTKGLEDLYEGKKLQKLESSKVLKSWLKFFEEWFGVNIELKYVQIVKENRPGSPLIFVPEKIKLSDIFKVLKERCGLKTNILNPDEEIVMSRRKKRTYLLYAKNRYTLIEESLLFLYDYYKTGDKLKTRKGVFCNHLSWSKHENGSNIRTTGFSKNYRQKSDKDVTSVWDGSYSVSIWRY
jgi:hypothetical protein